MNSIPPTPPVVSRPRHGLPMRMRGAFRPLFKLPDSFFEQAQQTEPTSNLQRQGVDMFSKLPYELSTHIFGYLQGDDASQISLGFTSKHFAMLLHGLDFQTDNLIEIRLSGSPFRDNLWRLVAYRFCEVCQNHVEHMIEGQPEGYEIRGLYKHIIKDGHEAWFDFEMEHPATDAARKCWICPAHNVVTRSRLQSFGIDSSMQAYLQNAPTDPEAFYIVSLCLDLQWFYLQELDPFRRWDSNPSYRLSVPIAYLNASHFDHLHRPDAESLTVLWEPNPDLDEEEDDYREDFLRHPSETDPILRADFQLDEISARALSGAGRWDGAVSLSPITLDVVGISVAGHEPCRIREVTMLPIGGNVIGTGAQNLYHWQLVYLSTFLFND